MKLVEQFLPQPTLVIGDVHGHLSRLEALLLQEEIIGPCDMCAATGDVGLETMEICPACKGVGTTRINHDVEVVQLGDLGHFGSNHCPGQGMRPTSPTADLLAYQYGREWLDIVLWGNHDRAVFDPTHAFGGYHAPMIETRHIMSSMKNLGQLRLAHAAHGYLLTHAGLHAAFKHNLAPNGSHTDPECLAIWLNLMNDDDDPAMKPFGPTFRAIRDAIGTRRGGGATAGGILWRDAGESLYDGFPQVFGHSSKPKVRTYESARTSDSYCIDIGDADNGRLAGIWLPSKRIVEVSIT